MSSHRSFRSPQSLLAILLVLSAGPVLAAKDSKAQTPTFEGTSQVVSVEVPVNAVDRDGQPVRGLTADDFEVWDGNERQKISSFEAVDLATLEAAHAAAGPGSVQPLPELDSSARRHFLLLFDLSFSSPTAVLKARLAARDFMLNHLHPSDLAAVATFTIERGPKLVMTFTPDRAQLARAIDTLGMQHGLQVDKADPLRFIIEGDFNASGASSMMAESNRAQRDQMVFQELQALSLLAEKTERTYAIGRISDFSRSLTNLGRALNSVQGRKQVVMFSEGFDSRLLIGRDTLDADNDLDNANIAGGQHYLVDNDARYGSTTLQNEMNRMLEEFRRADCVIQAVDIGGLRDRTDASNRPQVNGQESLFYMANETGGELYKDANNLGDQLNRLLNRTSLTYVLTFERSDLKTDGAYHHLRVKAARLPAGGHLAYRTGYYAPRPFRDLSPLEKNLLASDNIAAGTPRRDIAMNVLLAPFRASPKEAYVPVILEVAGRSLLSGQPGDKVNVEIYAYASDAQGQMRDFFTQKVGFDLSKGRKGFEETGLKYYGHLDLPPGDYRVRVLVRNAQTGHTAVESVQVQVPAYAETRPFLLPPFFIDKGAHWLMLRENEQTGRGGSAGSTSVFYPFTVAGEPYVPAAKPVLRGDEKARVCLVAYNLGKGDLSVQGQVVSPDGKSAPASGLAMVERTATGISGLDKVLATFEPGALGAGDYVLQIAVTDPRTGRKEMNSLPFKVVH
ncbi:MAG TPA: VWA domain-containing protein [Thermoanaerobaculia bacterium]|jgi:VWFA-related protein|nr:VWA domain-containing protein [Thermoanaerobaculia bacterium]